MTFGSLFDVLQMERVKNPSADFTKALCDYGRYSILRLSSHESPINTWRQFINSEDDLAEYLEPFQNHFEDCMGIDIYTDEDYVGVHFHMVAPDEKNKIRFFNCQPFLVTKRGSSEVCKVFVQMTGEEHSAFENTVLFLDKKQGFYENSFYFVKPHYRKHWLKAVGYLDLAEVIHAIDGADEEDYLAFFGDDYF